MHNFSLFQKKLQKALSFVHQTRLKALFIAVDSLLRGGSLPLTVLGRNTAISQGKRRHQIKRIDRLLGNANLCAEREKIYEALAKLEVGTRKRFPIVVDWTPVGPCHLHHALVAGIPKSGRTAIIYSEVHPEKKLSNPIIEARFLEKLKDILPRGCRPIVITDAGFRVPWFKSVLRNGWDYIGRTRGTIGVKNQDNRWQTVRELFQLARRKPRDMGSILLTQTQKFETRLILSRSRTGEKEKRKTRYSRKIPNRRVEMNQTERYRSAAAEPWAIVTSCKDFSSDQISSLYRSRMSIEETFRDIKSHRFGWSFEDARSSSCKRYEILLLLAAIALHLILFLGTLAESLGVHRDHQANTQKRRALSLFFLEKTILQEWQGRGFFLSRTRTKINKLRQHMPGVQPCR